MSTCVFTFIGTALEEQEHMILTGHSFLGIQWLQILYLNAFPKKIGISGLKKVIMSSEN